MSRSDHGHFFRLITSHSSSLPASKANSMNQDHPQYPQPTNLVALNVLFLGETTLGEGSIIDLIGGSGQQMKTLRHAGRRDDDACSIALDGKTFVLRALPPPNEYMSPAALAEGIQNTLTDLRRDGGVHLLVYCMHALHPIGWIHDVYHTIVSHSVPSPHAPAVAVVAGISDAAEQERWWASNEGTFVEQGPCFDDHRFIRMMTVGAQSSAGDHISESRRLLHALILQNCTRALSSETDSDIPRSTGNSFQSPFGFPARKSPSHLSTNSRPIDVVLLGEIGVGKSSLINSIAREDVAEVSSDTVGCTKTTIRYTFEEKGRTFNLYDTPGLVDPLMGAEAFIHPIDTIQKLIRNLGDGNGPDLLLFCIDNSKPTTALQRNYRLFCQVICEGKVPFALAITKLEESQDVDEWRSQHGPTIRRYGIDCSGYFGLGRGKRHLELDTDPLGQLRASFLSFLVTCIDRQKNRMSSLRSSMSRTMVSVTSFFRAQVWTPEKALMDQCGLEEQTARELASRIVSLKKACSDRAHK